MDQSTMDPPLADRALPAANVLAVLLLATQFHQLGLKAIKDGLQFFAFSSKHVANTADEKVLRELMDKTRRDILLRIGRLGGAVLQVQLFLMLAMQVCGYQVVPAKLFLTCAMQVAIQLCLWYQPSTSTCQHVLTLVHVIILIRTFTEPTFSHWSQNNTGRALARVVLGAGMLSNKKACFWALVFLAANLYCLHDFAALDTEGAVHTGLHQQLFHTMFILLVSNVFEDLVQQYVLTSLKSSELAEEQSVGKKLLSIFCDAQVRLDSYFNIIGDHTNFASMLMASEGRLRNLDFLHHLLDDGRAGFKQFFANSTSTPSSMRVLFRDSAGIAVAARVYCVSIQTHSGSASHLVGICEESSEPRQDAEALPVPATTHPGGAQPAPEILDMASELPVSEYSATASSGSMSEKPYILDTVKVTCFADPSRYLLIRDLQMRFIPNSAFPKGNCFDLISFVSEWQADAVELWLQDVWHIISGSSGEDLSLRSFCDLRFYDPTDTTRRLKVGRAWVCVEDSLENHASEQDPDSGAEETFTLNFEKIKHTRASPKRCRGASVTS
eukprot:TRINITY_DN66721_c0_g1_i1.p1 TRINITY_DN66721_c0_g1~~TRINITY_DN66721_c0_g1_i1.p1  ORF type:complete len:555 (-),score=74.28 TRINITY_DN66721_c0_g1_i1:299-1963(-)